MVGEACLPSNAYYPRTPDYTLCSGVHVCWSEHSDSSFVYGFMSLDYGFGTMTATTFYITLCTSCRRLRVPFDRTYLTSLQLVLRECVAVLQSLPAFQSVDFIFYSFGIIDSIVKI